MFLNLNHRRLVGYSYARSLVSECYELSNRFPLHEKYGITAQIRRAAVSVYLNIAEGASRKSDTERKRYFEIARGSVMEIDAILDIANDNGYLKDLDLTEMQEKLVRSFKLISGMIASDNLF
ncbi:four helix bundle protein [Flavihumibacter sp.]|uniref:four helix bundle protein n=1 Tax=Flavihumibacter sp. TaxID=1913981 RepID=UPI002FC9EF8D